ncbi:hypothetical protein EI77_01429 [Prosthecobacter fusiformis]|uniref:SGNH hydrolase-type esterase domain-containing protein n=1 Tax=Prosthecobacter fusiformis TaxID=48464 RepID=A0A4V3FG21_9BACT|nr:hypothetical protein [Prosthecobacter fusiformis]TDU72963.1 hypothetical protein EI77_01429 [Prosthecobacter fusiformis]
MGCLGLLASPLIAQTAPDLVQKKAEAEALEKRLPVPSLTPKTNFDLSPARQERLEKFLPKTYRKLSQREPLHLLVLGDATAVQIKDAPITDTFPGVFASHLATQFFYTGGVQETGKVVATGVPTIVLRSLARSDSSVVDAAPILESAARQTAVDLVIICYGQNDAAMQPPTFSRAIGAAIAGARELGAEVILCSPWLPVAEQSESVLGLTRPLADVLEETASGLGILHVDLGDLSRLLSLATTQPQDEGQVFDRIERTYREFFYQEADSSFIPRPSLHRQLGSLIYKDLLEPRSTLPWQISSASARETEPGKLALTYKLKNVGTTALVLKALPLIANGWKPVEARSSLTLEAGTSQALTVSYTCQGEAPPLQEALLRQPVLICTETAARIETLHATLEPVSIVWGLETLFNQEEAFLAGCQIVNPGKGTIKGSWQAEFGSQTLDDNFNLPGQATTPLNLRFNLPKNSPSVSTIPLRLTVKIGSQTLVSTRNVTLTRNLGLDQSVPLTPATSAQSLPTPITLTPSADANSLTLTLDIPSTDLPQESPDGVGPAWQVEVNLDARSYGKRLEPGGTSPLRATGKATDGPGKVHPIPAWAFGNGYAASFDPKEFKAALSSTKEKRQITFTIPRTYLYLHEWALENGNSQLGLSVRLTLQGPDGYLTHSLPLTAKPINDVEALVVLELAKQPTSRVTADVE